MPVPAQVRLQPGRVYRTEEFRRWGANPARLADRLVRERRLVRLAHGMFLVPQTTKFGVAPPAAAEVLRALLKGDEYATTGPERWNALGLGATTVSPLLWIYNRKRSGDFELGGLRLHLRRVAFPSRPSPEWLVVDLLENLSVAGVEASVVETRLAAALAQRRFDARALKEMAACYGAQRTRDLVERATRLAAA